MQQKFKWLINASVVACLVLQAHVTGFRYAAAQTRTSSGSANMASTSMDHLIINDDADNTGLNIVAKRVLNSIKSRNWRAVFKDADAVIYLEHEHRSYPQYCPDNCRENIFPTYLIGNGDDAYHTGIIGCSLATTVPLTKVNAERLGRFATWVDRTYSAPMEGAIEVGGDVHGAEINSLGGPAAEGRIASGSYWRIEFRLVNRRWRVSKLILEDH